MKYLIEMTNNSKITEETGYFFIKTEWFSERMINNEKWKAIIVVVDKRDNFWNKLGDTNRSLLK